MSSSISDDMRCRLFDPVDDDGYGIIDDLEEIYDVCPFKGAWSEDYRKGKFYICLDVTSRLKAEKLHLVFGSIPLSGGVDDGSAGSDAKFRTGYPSLGNASNDCEGDGMFIVSGYSTECPESIISTGVFIASRVWLATPQDWKQLIRKSLTWDRLPEGQAFFEIRGALAEGEVSPITTFFSDKECCGKGELIESVPVILDDIRGKATEFSGKRFDKANFVNTLSGLSIELYESSADIRLSKEVFGDGGELGRFFRSPRS